MGWGDCTEECKDIGSCYVLQPELLMFSSLRSCKSFFPFQGDYTGSWLFILGIRCSVFSVLSSGIMGAFIQPKEVCTSVPSFFHPNSNPEVVPSIYLIQAQSLFSKLTKAKSIELTKESQYNGEAQVAVANICRECLTFPNSYFTFACSVLNL